MKSPDLRLPNEFSYTDKNRFNIINRLDMNRFKSQINTNEDVLEIGGDSLRDKISLLTDKINKVQHNLDSLRGSGTKYHLPWTQNKNRESIFSGKMFRNDQQQTDLVEEKMSSNNWLSQNSQPENLHIQPCHNSYTKQIIESVSHTFNSHNNGNINEITMGNAQNRVKTDNHIKNNKGMKTINTENTLKNNNNMAWNNKDANTLGVHKNNNVHENNINKNSNKNEYEILQLDIKEDKMLKSNSEQQTDQDKAKDRTVLENQKDDIMKPKEALTHSNVDEGSNEIMIQNKNNWTLVNNENNLKTLYPNENIPANMQHSMNPSNLKKELLIKQKDRKTKPLISSDSRQKRLMKTVIVPAYDLSDPKIARSNSLTPLNAYEIHDSNILKPNFNGNIGGKTEHFGPLGPNIGEPQVGPLVQKMEGPKIGLLSPSVGDPSNMGAFGQNIEEPQMGSFGQHVGDPQTSQIDLNVGQSQMEPFGQNFGNSPIGEFTPNIGDPGKPQINLFGQNNAGQPQIDTNSFTLTNGRDQNREAFANGLHGGFAHGKLDFVHEDPMLTITKPLSQSKSTQHKEINSGPTQGFITFEEMKRQQRFEAMEMEGKNGKGNDRPITQQRNSGIDNSGIIIATNPSPRKETLSEKLARLNDMINKERDNKPKQERNNEPSQTGNFVHGEDQGKSSGPHHKDTENQKQDFVNDSKRNHYNSVTYEPITHRESSRIHACNEMEHKFDKHKEPTSLNTEARREVLPKARIFHEDEHHKIDEHREPTSLNAEARREVLPEARSFHEKDYHHNLDKNNEAYEDRREDTLHKPSRYSHGEYQTYRSESDQYQPSHVLNVKLAKSSTLNPETSHKSRHANGPRTQTPRRKDSFHEPYKKPNGHQHYHHQSNKNDHRSMKNPHHRMRSGSNHLYEMGKPAALHEIGKTASALHNKMKGTRDQTFDRTEQKPSDTRLFVRNEKRGRSNTGESEEDNLNYSDDLEQIKSKTNSANGGYINRNRHQGRVKNPNNNENCEENCENYEEKDSATFINNKQFVKNKKTMERCDKSRRKGEKQYVQSNKICKPESKNVEEYKHPREQLEESKEQLEKGIDDQETGNGSDNQLTENESVNQNNNNENELGNKMKNHINNKTKSQLKLRQEVSTTKIKVSSSTKEGTSSRYGSFVNRYKTTTNENLDKENQSNAENLKTISNTTEILLLENDKTDKQVGSHKTSPIKTKSKQCNKKRTAKWENTSFKQKSKEIGNGTQTKHGGK
ncbi:hypothetical protein WDU94_002425 [Cyamophila willieti]